MVTGIATFLGFKMGKDFPTHTKDIYIQHLFILIPSPCKGN